MDDGIDKNITPSDVKKNKIEHVQFGDRGWKPHSCLQLSSAIHIYVPGKNGSDGWCCDGK